VTFTPSANGSRSASVTITDNAADSPQNVALSGTGVSPVVSLSPSSLSFGNQNTGSTSTAQTVTLTNTGTAALSISSIAITGTNASDFAQTATTCPSSPSTLAANASCTISVTFTPSANGSRSASLTFTDNATNSPQGAALSGTGVTATYLSDGFESGNFSLWTVPSNTGKASVQTSVVNSGTNAAALTNASGQTTN